MIKIGKKNGGLYSADEYGSKMLDGQWKRIQNIASKNDRKIIEDFLKRRDEIMKMPDGFVKSIKLQTLKNDIESYNLKIPVNRRILKLDL